MKALGGDKKATRVHHVCDNASFTIWIGGDTNSHHESNRSKPKELQMRQRLMRSRMDHSLCIGLTRLICNHTSATWTRGAVNFGLEWKLRQVLENVQVHIMR